MRSAETVIGSRRISSMLLGCWPHDVPRSCSLSQATLLAESVAAIEAIGLVGVMVRFSHGRGLSRRLILMLMRRTEKL
jgi:hypothetical protein